MTRATTNILAEQLALADMLFAGRDAMLDPQDLPGRYGRVVRSIDYVLQAIDCPGIVGGGWAVWRHGYVSRVTQDIDIVLPNDRIDDFLQAAAVSGFQVLVQIAGRWPKVHHKETDVQVDILPEGERPGIPPDFAPTTIPSPKSLGATGVTLQYIGLANLIELKLAASRLKDKADVAELVRANREKVDEVRQHLAIVHHQYAEEFDRLVDQSRKDEAQR